MQYFMYSPIDMSAEEAFQRACRYLNEDVIVHVKLATVEIVRHSPGTRPHALPDTYLVRVEPDGSLRIVHKALS